MDTSIAAWKHAVIENYGNFSGRLGVGGYWRYFAVNIAIGVFLAILSQVSDIFLIVYVLFALAVFIPGLAAGVRRLHDTDRSGMWLLIGLVPCVGFIILIVFFVQPGTPSGNQYGEVPAS